MTSPLSARIAERWPGTSSIRVLLPSYTIQKLDLPWCSESSPEPDRRILISRLTLVEIQSVFAIKVRTGVIVRPDVELLRQRMVAHVAAGDFQIYAVADSHYLAAELLLRQYGFDYRLRTLDALQLAVAMRLRAQGLVDHFVAADKSICEVADIERFSVLNPEN